MERDEALQSLCREYLTRLRYLADKHGIGGFVSDLIHANRRKECEGTRHEVEMLARMVNDDRIGRSDIPNILGKSYRQCHDDGDFDKIKKLPRQGIYSKVHTLLFKHHKNKQQ